MSNPHTSPYSKTIASRLSVHGLLGLGRTKLLALGSWHFLRPFILFLFPLVTISAILRLSFDTAGTPEAKQCKCSFRVPAEREWREATTYNHPQVEGGDGRLRVFMYELPRRFNWQLVEFFELNRGMNVSNTTDGLKYPAHQHSGEWWLYFDLTRPEAERESSPAVRVFSWEEADVFFVPVFSSLSLIVIPVQLQREKGMKPVAPHDDAKMQEDLMDWLEAQEPWKRSGGRDHVFPVQDPNSMWKVLPRLQNSVLLVSDFGRLQAARGSLGKDIVVPYVHRIGTFHMGKEKGYNRSTLLFFAGNRYRKDGGMIRNELFNVLEGEPDVLMKEGTPSPEGRIQSTVGMRSSKYCLHPAGDTPSACRMFDAMVNLCVPVVVSDYIELPFEDIIDYSGFSVFVSTADAVRPGYLVWLLREGITARRLRRMQFRLRKVRKFFEWKALKTGVVSQVWRRVAAKLPTIREMINRDKRIVHPSMHNCTWSCGSGSSCPLPPTYKVPPSGKSIK